MNSDATKAAAPPLVSSINPTQSAAYSLNLYRWLRAQRRRNHNDCVQEGVYRLRDDGAPYGLFTPGTLFIGRPYDDAEDLGIRDFSGAHLMSVLCMGRAAERVCYPTLTPRLELIPDFWTVYQAVGRCAIDPTHQEHFIDERYRYQGETRSCLWCGAAQYRQIRQTVVESVTWVEVPISRVA